MNDRDELREARHKLGLSVKDWADMLDTDEQTIRRIEMRANAETARNPAPRMMRLAILYHYLADRGLLPEVLAILKVKLGKK
jgi:DNA-binding XRE family transcriptional regulator